MKHLACLALLVTACHAAEPPKPVSAAPTPAALDVYQACARVWDRAVMVYADAWAENNGVLIRNETERWALHETFDRDLRERGTRARFDHACRTSITRPIYDCAMAASDAKAFGKCAP